MKRSLIKISAFMLLLCGVYACQTKNDTYRSLSGEWNFALDSTDVGEKENWAMKSFQEQVKLPGSLQEQGKGYDVSVNTQWTGNVADKSWYTEEEYAKYREPGNVKVPFWLTPDKHYVGVAWYQKEIEIPESWKNKRVQFEFERTSLGNLTLCGWKENWAFEYTACSSQICTQLFDSRKAFIVVKS